MAIKCKCQCGFAFAAKDELAGRKVKCPKCQGVVVIPGQPGGGAKVASGQNQGAGARAAGAQAAPRYPAAATAIPASTGGAYRLADVLDEVGVKKVHVGPTCPSCGSELYPTSVICVQCGFNTATGEHLETEVDLDTGIESVGVTDVSKVISKAELELDEMPISGEDQDFGDGSDSYLVAIAALAVVTVLLMIGVGVVLIMDQIAEDVNPGRISMIAAGIVAAGCAVWITIVAFRVNMVHAIACILTGGLWCIPYGFIQGRGTMLPAIILLASLLIGVASYFLNPAGGAGPGY